jgi:hypothetical protein
MNHLFKIYEEGDDMFYPKSINSEIIGEAIRTIYQDKPWPEDKRKADIIIGQWEEAKKIVSEFPLIGLPQSKVYERSDWTFDTRSMCGRVAINAQNKERPLIYVQFSVQTDTWGCEEIPPVKAYHFLSTNGSLADVKDAAREFQNILVNHQKYQELISDCKNDKSENEEKSTELSEVISPELSPELSPKSSLQKKRNRNTLITEHIDEYIEQLDKFKKEIPELDDYIVSFNRDFKDEDISEAVDGNLKWENVGPVAVIYLKDMSHESIVKKLLPKPLYAIDVEYRLVPHTKEY